MKIQHEHGSVLVEFALVSLVLYLLLAATIEFGRLMFSAQAVQDVARVAARELAVTPLPAAITFDDALIWQDPVTLHFPVRERIFDPACLVVDLTNFATDADIDAYFATMPVVNKALRPLMMVDRDGGRNLLRYPGALLTDPNPRPCGNPPQTSGLTVGIPRVLARAADGVESIDWVPILEEIRPDPADPATGAFSVAGTLPQQGLVAVRINYPYQAAMMTGYQQKDVPAFDPNMASPIHADDTFDTPPPPAVGALLPELDDEDAIGAYSGRYGLGRLKAVGATVRPFRKLLGGQAIFRREVFQ